MNVNNYIDVEWLNQAIIAIKTGLADKLCKGNILIYKVTNNLIRIDMRE